MKYLGIDLGSSYIKAVLIDIDNCSVISTREESTPAKLKNDNPNAFEIPAANIMEVIDRLILESVDKYGDIEGIILSTQMHGFVYSYPGAEDLYVSWQDMRCMDRNETTGKTYLEELSEIISEDDMADNGVYLKPSLGICNLYAICMEDSGIPTDGTFYTLGSYVISKLTGNNCMHIQNAAPTGIADVKNGRLNKELIEKLGFSNVTFPELVTGDYDSCGYYDHKGRKIAVFPDYGDTQVSAVGSCINKGDVLINTATASQVMLCTEGFESGNYEIRPYFDSSYLKVISNMPAGRDISVLIDFFRDMIRTFTGADITSEKMWEIIHRERLESDRDLRVGVHFYKNPNFCDGGYIDGITNNNLQISTIFKAVYKDMAQTYWRFIGKLTKSTDSIRRIVCAGGVNWKTPELVEEIRLESCKPCVLSPVKNEAIAGMLILSLICSGKCGNLSESVALLRDELEKGLKYA